MPWKGNQKNADEPHRLECPKQIHAVPMSTWVYTIMIFCLCASPNAPALHPLPSTLCKDTSLGRQIQDKPPIDIHLLIVLLSLKFQPIAILLAHGHDLRAIERRRIRIPGQNLFSHSVGGKEGALFGDGDE